MTWHPRGDWGAAAPTGDYSWIPDEVGLAYHWEGPGQGDYAQGDVPAKIRGIQRYHMGTHGWSDIAYSFVFDRYGDIWDARGWNARTAANGSNAGNGGFLAACYLGGEGDPFTPAAQMAAATIFRAHVERGGAPVATCHHDHTSTACPGGDIHNWIIAGGHLSGAVIAPPEDDLQPDERAALLRVDAAIGNPGAISGKDRTAYEAFLRFLVEAEGRTTGAVYATRADFAQVKTGLDMVAAGLAAVNQRIEGIQMNGGGVTSPGAPISLTPADQLAIANQVADIISARMAS